jgi:DNA helicase-2/ATP-dependent DNA helicase PcrA
MTERLQMDRPAQSTGDLPTAVAEEERLLKVVLSALQRAAAPRATEDYDAELLRLRDSLAEERLPEDQASLLEQMDRVSHLAAQRARVNLAGVDGDSPYFGHLRLEDEHGRRDVLIGKSTCIIGSVRIVDWRNAPISRIFYQYREGDDYALEIAGREVEGRVLLRRTVTISRGVLLRVATPEQTYLRGEAGWSELGAAAPALRGGSGSAARPDRTRPVLGTADGSRRIRVDKHLPEIASLLDPEQFALITRPDSGLVAIQGSAGSGKTTVALHRVAYLAFQNPQRFAPHRSLVVVLSPGLAAYISQVLPALGVSGVTVATFESWASELRQRHFPESPRAYAEDTPAVVSRLKRHTALLPMLADAARTAAGQRPLDLFDELFTNRSWLGEGFSRHAPGAFRDAELDPVHDWCRRQHFTRVDGGGPNEDDIATLDAEDDTILLYLYQLLVGPLRYRRDQSLRYAHLVVDEVQDFSPLELRVLFGAVPAGQPITLAGDVAQQVVDSSDFGDWGRALEALGQGGVRVSPLRVSYRSTAPIMEAAHAVLGPLAPAEPPAAARPGAPVELFRFAGYGEAFAFLSEALQELTLAEPSASVAILTSDAGRADHAYAALARADLPGLRRVREYDFSFAPGVEVTDIRQAKGLEFDYVITLDVDTLHFPESDAARRLLHVGMTRAAHQCWLVSVGTPSRILPSWLPVEER